MNLRIQPATLLSLPLTLALALSMSACSDDTNTGSSGESGSESGSETGDGDGDPAGTTVSTTNGDGDGDDPACPVGSEGCPCTNGGSCDVGLMCDGDMCIPATPGDGDGDAPGDGDGDTPGDGDGDTPGDGDGDTPGDGDGDDPGNTCQGDEFIEIDAVDADYDGWDAIMSNLGEGMILAWDDVTPDASISWDVDVPCDDDWHVWVRGIDWQDQDSFFVLVDGEPSPPPIFELDCTDEPGQQQNPVYLWGELNWRDQQADGCDYVEDPWVQGWAAGSHNVTLGYRESYAVTRIWITNTDQMPPNP